MYGRENKADATFHMKGQNWCTEDFTIMRLWRWICNHRHLAGQAPFIKLKFMTFLMSLCCTAAARQAHRLHRTRKTTFEGWHTTPKTKDSHQGFPHRTNLSRGARSRRRQRRPAVCWWCSSSLATPASCGCQTGPRSAPRTWWVPWTCSPSCAVDRRFKAITFRGRSEILS